MGPVPWHRAGAGWRCWHVLASFWFTAELATQSSGQKAEKAASDRVVPSVPCRTGGSCRQSEANCSRNSTSEGCAMVFGKRICVAGRGSGAVFVRRKAIHRRWSMALVVAPQIKLVGARGATPEEEAL